MFLFLFFFFQSFSDFFFQSFSEYKKLWYHRSWSVSKEYWKRRLLFATLAYFVKYKVWRNANIATLRKVLIRFFFFLFLFFSFFLFFFFCVCVFCFVCFCWILFLFLLLLFGAGKGDLGNTFLFLFCFVLFFSFFLSSFFLWINETETCWIGNRRPRLQEEGKKGKREIEKLTNQNIGGYHLPVKKIFFFFFFFFFFLSELLPNAGPKTP